MVTNYQTQWSFDQGQWIGLGTWFITTSETGIEAKFLQSLPHSQQAKFCPYMYSPNSLLRVIWRGTARAASMSNPISVIKLFSRSGPLDCHERKTIWKANTLCPPTTQVRKKIRGTFIYYWCLGHLEPGVDVLSWRICQFKNWSDMLSKSASILNLKGDVIPDE